MLPIYFASYASVKYVKASDSKKSSAGDDDESEDEQESESLSSEDAMWFPITGSAVLFSLYLLFKYFSKEYINYLLTAYFGLVGCFALTVMLDGVIAPLLEVVGLKFDKFKLRITKHKGKETVYK